MAHPQLEPLYALAKSVAEPMGFEVQSVVLHSHRAPQALIVALKRADGTDVSLDDCASYSSAFGDALELAELIAGAYVLEITSPGVAELLQDDRDFRSFRGFPVRVLQRDSQGGQLSRQGSLLGRDADVVELNLRGRVVRIPREDVLEVRLTTPES
ncbi:MAG: ribosome assembly cofactor RimP [Synechococcus sp.]|nr:ribosome assembly cofactor RimP [Synechococcus sp.]